MNKQNSGKIFSFELNLKLGYGYCMLIDHSDRFPFDGRIIYVYNFFEKWPDDHADISLIENAKVLSGPTPVNRLPIIRGKNAWKYIGKTQKFSHELPVFKLARDIKGLYSSTDWSTVQGWYQKINFNDIGNSMTYDEIRELEAPFLYSLSDLVTRATMQFLLIKAEPVEHFFDLSKEPFKSIYIQILNTSINKKKASHLLKKLTKK